LGGVVAATAGHGKSSDPELEAGRDIGQAWKRRERKDILVKERERE